MYKNEACLGGRLGWVGVECFQLFANAIITLLQVFNRPLRFEILSVPAVVNYRKPSSNENGDRSKIYVVSMVDKLLLKKVTQLPNASIILMKMSTQTNFLF